MKKTERIYTPINSFKHLVELMESRGDKTAFKYPVGREYATLSYGDFAHEIKAIAAGLSAAGLAGKRVAVIGETSHQWVASYLAVVTSGGVIIPMDKELAIEEIEGFLAGVDAEAIVYSASFNQKLAAAMVDALWDMSKSLFSEKTQLMQLYKENCITLGKDIQVLRGDSVRSAKAVDLDEDGGLVVEYADGTRETVASGEVSIRGMYGYV